MNRDFLPLATDFGIVRSARPEDTKRVVEMVGKLAAHHGDTSVLRPVDIGRDAFGPNPWIYVLVAETASDVVGYAAMCGLIRLQLGMRGMDMHHLFTEAAFRGQGVGRSLVDACKIKALSLSCGYMTVGTHPDNRAAQTFYEALGFERGNGSPPRFSIPLRS